MSAAVKFKRDKGEGLLLLVPNSQALLSVSSHSPACILNFAALVQCLRTQTILTH